MRDSETLGSQGFAMMLAAGLFAGGSLLTLVATVAPHSPSADIAGSWVVTFLSAVIAAVYWLGRDSLPRWTLYVGVALGTVMITSGIYINGERDGGAAALNEVYYVWPVVFAAYYFPVRALIGGARLRRRLLRARPADRRPWRYRVDPLADRGDDADRRRGADQPPAATRRGAASTRLSETARRDALTGLLNRRGFEERLDVELARATRVERPVALILSDVDHFKTVNDRLGHPAGDAVLLRVAGVLEGIGRRGDTVARLGGEEFVFIVPDADAERAFELAERARAALERTFADEPVPLTASFGTVAFPADGTTAASLLETADRALYAAKDAGRNRTARALAAAA